MIQMDPDVKITKDFDSPPEPISFSSPLNSQARPGKKSRKAFFVVLITLIVLLGAGFLFRDNIKSVLQPGSIEPTPSPVAQITQPLPTTPPLVRSEWSLEILNGSGVAGLAKKIAVELEALGYPVVKTGNADKSSYLQTQIMVQKDLSEKVNLVIADIKDVVMIASQAGELKDSTASARIILGKDLQ